MYNNTTEREYILFPGKTHAKDIQCRFKKNILLFKVVKKYICWL